jgi:hypothetical protein
MFWEVAQYPGAVTSAFPWYLIPDGVSSLWVCVMSLEDQQLMPVVFRIVVCVVLTLTGNSSTGCLPITIAHAKDTFHEKCKGKRNYKLML